MKAEDRTRHGSEHEREARAARTDSSVEQTLTDADQKLNAPSASSPEAALIEQIEKLRRQSAADRERAATDRARATRDRADAARERARLEAELRSAHLDSLTGAYRREMGPLAIAHEIDRVRRSDGALVVAFIDVDGLKAVNDRDGHAAGDRVLQAVVRQIRARLRSYDPIIRHGGDEFICVLTDTKLREAQRRFALISDAIETEAGVRISVGFAALVAADTPERLTNRADSAMLKVKRRHYSA